MDSGLAGTRSQACEGCVHLRTLAYTCLRLPAPRNDKSECAQCSHSGELLRLDVRGLDDRPPLLDLGLVVGSERLLRLLLAWRQLLALIEESLPHRRIGQRLHD